MFACSRFMLRAGPSTLVREFNSGIRNATSNAHNRNNFLCTSAAAILVATTTSNSTSSNGLGNGVLSISAAEPRLTAKAKINLPRVDMTYCGFPKNLVSAPSCVVNSDVFGDDACFAVNYSSAYVAGVADGVGGWRSYGVNPSEFSSQLMRHCADIVEEGEFEPSRPDLVIKKAFNRLKSAPCPTGSSTACVLIVYQKMLYSANLGDSGYLVCRKGKVIERSKEQTHYFNAPFQLTLLPNECELEGIIMDKPEQADLGKLELESGDIILLATDGLWDNVPENVIVEALTDAKPSTLQATCNSIALIARRLSRDEQYASPFAVKAGHHGIRTVGGKPDDITIVLLYVS